MKLLEKISVGHEKFSYVWKTQRTSGEFNRRETSETTLIEILEVLLEITQINA